MDGLGRVDVFVVFHLRYWRVHAVRLLLAMVGVAAGSLVVVTVFGTFGSLTGAASRLANLAPRADLEIDAPSDIGFPEKLSDEVRSVRGVRDAVPLVRTSVLVKRERVLLLGVDDRSRALGTDMSRRCISGFSSRNFSADPPPFMTTSAFARHLGVVTGDAVVVHNGFGSLRARLAGIVSCPALTKLNEGFVAVTLLPFAQQISGRPGQLDSLLVVKSEDSDGLAQRVKGVVGGSADVATPDARVDQVRRASRPFQQVSLVMVGLALVVGAFVVYNTTSMAALERRREVATLRALGGGRRRLVWGFLLEAGLMGLVGSVAGAILGVALGRFAVRTVPDVLVEAVGLRPVFTLPTMAVPTAVALGTLATIAGSVLPMLRATAVSPTEAMRPEGELETRSERRVVPSLVVLGGAAILFGIFASLIASGNLAIAGFGFMSGGVILASTGLKGPLAVLTAAVASRLGDSGRLAAASIEQSPRRVWATMLAIVAAVGSVIALRATATNQTDTLVHKVSSLARPDLVIATSPLDELPNGARMPNTVAGQLRALPGTANVVAGQAAFVDLGSRRVAIQAVRGDSATPLLALAPPMAQRELRSGAGVVVTRTLAEWKHLHPRSTLALTTATGPRAVPVLAVVDLPSSVDGGSLLMDLDSFERWYARPGATWFELYLAPTARTGEIRRAVRFIARARGLPVWIGSGHAVVSANEQVFEQNSAVFDAVLWIVLGAATIAVLNTLLMAVVQRRRELGILRALGGSRRRVRRVMLAEAVSIGIVGSAIGAGFGILAHVMAVTVTSGLAGFSIQYRFLMMPLALAISAGTAATLIGTFIPALRAGQVDIIEAIGYE